MKRLLSLLTIYATFLKVALVGACGVAAQAIALVALVEYAGLYPVFGNILAAEVGVVVNFIINNAWTFKEERSRPLPTRFALFHVSILGSIAIQTVVMWVGVEFFGRSLYLLYAAMGIGLGLISNYLLYTRLVWKKHPVAHTE